MTMENILSICNAQVITTILMKKWLTILSLSGPENGFNIVCLSVCPALHQYWYHNPLTASSQPLFLFGASLWPKAREILFANASHQTRLDTRSKARRSIKVDIKGRGRSGTSWCSNPAGLYCSLTHYVQWGKQFHEPKCGSGHGCRVIAWTRQQGLAL